MANRGEHNSVDLVPFCGGSAWQITWRGEIIEMLWGDSTQAMDHLIELMTVHNKRRGDRFDKVRVSDNCWVVKVGGKGKAKS